MIRQLVSRAPGPLALLTSVRTKLLVAFGAVTLLALITAGFAVVSQQVILERQTDVRDQLLPTMADARRLQDLSRAIVAIGPNVIAANSQAERDTVLAPLTALKQEALAVAASLDVARAANLVPERSTASETGTVVADTTPQVDTEPVAGAAEPNSSHAASAETGVPAAKRARLAFMIESTAATLREMANVAAALEQAETAYGAAESQTKQALERLDHRAGTLFDLAHRDSKITLTNLQVAIAGDSDPDVIAAEFNRLSRERVDVMRWTLAVKDVVGSLSSGVERLRLVRDQDQALLSAQQLKDLLGALRRKKRDAILDEHAQTIDESHDELRSLLDPKADAPLPSQWSKIIALREQLKQRLAANEQISTRLNAAVERRFAAESKGIALAVDEVAAVIADAEKRVWSAAGIALLVSLLSIIYVSFFLLGRLVRLNKVMGVLAQGDTDVQISVTGHDEISRMAGAVEVFRNNMIAARALRSDMATAFNDKISGILDETESVVVHLQQPARQMRSSARDALDQSQTVNAVAQQTASNVHVVSTATEQMSEAIREIESKIVQTEEEVRKTSDVAAKSQQTLSDLARAAQRIGVAVQLITEIADKTNLLALNATIEAARAGDAGRGFAVVANEVKVLATDSAGATTEVRDIVKHMQEASESAQNALADIIGRVGTIEMATSAVASAIVEQAAATQEIGNNTAQAADSMETMAQAMNKVSGTVRGSDELSAEVENVANLVAKQTHRLRLDINEFIQSMADTKSVT